MNDERDLLDEIRDTLNITPSPDFQARLRMRVTSEPRRLFVWRRAHAIAAAAIVVVTGAMTLRMWPAGDVPMERHEAPVAVARVENPASEVVVAPPTTETRSERTAVVVRGAVARTRVASAAPAPIVLDTPAPLVQADQARLLEAFLMATNEGRIEPQALRPVDVPVEIEALPTPRPVEIALIRVEPLLDAGAEAPALHQDGAS